MLSEVTPLFFRIKIFGHERGQPELREVSAYLYDLNLVYEISRLATDPFYSDIGFHRYSSTRNGRPVDSSDRLRVEKLRLGSPFNASFILPAKPGSTDAVKVFVGTAKLLASRNIERARRVAEQAQERMMIECFRAEVAEANARRGKLEMARLGLEKEPCPESPKSSDGYQFVSSDREDPIMTFARELQASPPGVPGPLNQRLHDCGAASFIDPALRRLASSAVETVGVSIDCAARDESSESR
jgi:hypothetical protein